jgi:Cft2 family RNA processing exonuclease
MHAIFRSEYSESSILIRDYDLTINLAENALFSELFDLEDFRAICRFLYTNFNEYEPIITRLNQSILRFLYKKGTKSDVLLKLHSTLRYFGLPLADVDEIKDILYELFSEAKSEIDMFFELPISVIQKYPEYLTETTEQLNYDENIDSLKKWINNDILSKIETIKVNQFIDNWKPDGIDTVDDLVIKIESELEKKNLTSIPLVYNSLIKPYCKNVTPKKIHPAELSPDIPPELLQSYVEKLAYPITVHKEKSIEIHFLGGATIGSMGILICTPKSNILIDYGMSVANYQIPFWNEGLNHLDAILVTHAHLDHVGAIPYLYGQGYKGHVFGSVMTKNFANILLFDSLQLMKKNINSSIRNSDHRFNVLSKPQSIHKMLDNFVTISSENKIQLSTEVLVKPIPAHHIQGSYSYLLECGNKSVLFSGDVNLDSTTLFKNKSPELPRDADLTIVDSTYFGQPSFDAKKRDKLLFETVKESKRVIIPAFSVGRSQEILVKLEKAGITTKRKISTLGMATKVARLTGLKTKGLLSDHLSQPFEDEVVISGGGMLNGGYARELVEQTKDDPDTTIILCGYLAKNTLGYRLLHGLEPTYKQKVIFTRFSGHSSSDTLVNYLDSVKGKKVLVHIGDLTKDPFASEEMLKHEEYKKTDYHIPSLGSSLKI